MKTIEELAEILAASGAIRVELNVDQESFNRLYSSDSGDVTTIDSRIVESNKGLPFFYVKSHGVRIYVRIN